MQMKSKNTSKIHGEDGSNPASKEGPARSSLSPSPLQKLKLVPGEEEVVAVGGAALMKV